MDSMSTRRWLYLYLAALPAPTFVHDPALLALGLLLDKAQAQSTEVAMAMRSRGAFE